MITKMDKLAFLVMRDEYESFLKKLRSIGVVHIKEKAIDRDSEALKPILDKKSFILNAKNELSSVIKEKPDDCDVKSLSLSDFEEVCRKSKIDIEKLNSLRSQIKVKENEIMESEVWGEFDNETISLIQSYGYNVDFVTFSNKNREHVDEEYDIIEINTVKDVVFGLWIHKPEVTASDAISIVEKPKSNYMDLQKEKSVLETEESDTLSSLSNTYSVVNACLNNQVDVLDNKYNFQKVFLSGENILEDNFKYMEGWVPSENSDAVISKLEDDSVFVSKIEIQPEDNVPIKLKNNFFSKLFEPITSMFSMPNYNELDQTALFAPFFMLFFSMCFGDGGYGLLLFAVATIIRFRSKDKTNVNILKLLQWLGGSAFVVGMLMGTFFGVVLPYAKPEDYFLNQNNVMYLSIIIGIIQILFAKSVAAYKVYVQRGFKYSLAPFSWVLFLISVIVYMIYENVLNGINPYIVYAICGVSVLSLLVAFFYNSPGKNPFLNFGVGLWNTYNMASGLLGDTLSYIRLFAIGLTGGILGGIFNQLAIDQTAGLSWFLRIPIALIILLIGHTLNISLAMIGAFVHPLRLTFVEFYKNSEFEGGGIKYSPFVKK